MLIIESYPVAVTLSVITMLCWGSWANTQKLASREWKYQLFYWDYGLGVLLWAVFLAFTAGSLGSQGRSFLTDLAQADPANLGWALLGGILFNLSNILLVVAIDVAGLAVAFPIGVGLALVAGVITTYLMRPEGNPVALAGGVVLILIAIFLNALAFKRAAASHASSRPGFGVGLSVAAGLLMGCGFFGLVMKGVATRFVSPESGLITPYTALVVFSTGLFLSNFLWNSLMMRWPIVGEPVPFRDYFTRGSLRLHLVGTLGGVIWNIGMSFSLLASGAAGGALSYALGQGATMVAAAWGVFVWKEFRHAPAGTGRLLGAMFGLYIAGLAILVLSKS
jgi:glucose uptake protein